MKEESFGCYVQDEGEANIVERKRVNQVEGQKVEEEDAKAAAVAVAGWRWRWWH